MSPATSSSPIRRGRSSSRTACRSSRSTYENDDDAHRELGKDSRLFFTAPADGEYLLKVRDVRGPPGARLPLHADGPRAPARLQGDAPGGQPDGGRRAAPGSSRSPRSGSTASKARSGSTSPASRPASASTTPLIIEAGQLEAFGVVVAEEGARPPPADAAKADHGHGLGAGRRPRGHARGQPPGDRSSSTPRPKLRVAIAPAEGGREARRDVAPTSRSNSRSSPARRSRSRSRSSASASRARSPSATKAPGETCPSARSSTTSASTASWSSKTSRSGPSSSRPTASTPEQTRPFHLTTTAAGGVSSRPVRLRVTRPRLVTPALRAGRLPDFPNRRADRPLLRARAARPLTGGAVDGFQFTTPLDRGRIDRRIPRRPRERGNHRVPSGDSGANRAGTFRPRPRRGTFGPEPVS